MANMFYLVGKRLLISKSRMVVRGTVIFVLTRLLLLIGIVFVVEIALLMLGIADIHVPLVGRLLKIVQ